jgi:hypothetical protein
LKHPDATLATYKRRQMKYQKVQNQLARLTPFNHCVDMLLKYLQKHLKTIANIANIRNI